MTKKKHKKRNSIKQSSNVLVTKEDKTSNFKSLNLDVLIWVSAAIILVIGVIIRSYAFQTPIVGDEAVYGILGKKVMMGADIYKDAYEMKPPLLFYVYGISNVIFGWGATGLRITGLLLVLFNSFLIYRFARVYTSTAFSALTGVVCFFFLNNAYTYATETVAEHFLLSFVLSGYYLLVNPQLKKLNHNILIAGFLICGGAMVKQTGALFGAGAILLVVWYALNEYKSYKKNQLLKNILFLALGAFTMIALNILPIIISGTLSYAKYWLFEAPSLYTSTRALSDNWIYFDLIGGWILNYQFSTILLALLAVASIVVNYKQKYFPLLIIFLAIGVIMIFPGFRFYGQYWLPLMTISALFLISLKDTLKKLKLEGKEGVIISLLALATISIDTVNHRSEYFEEDYLMNIERAHNGSYPILYKAMVDYIKKDMQPNDRFLMLGSEPFTYYLMDQFPSSNHIYPRLISRNSPENSIYQQQAIEEMKNGGQEYILLSVTGLSWQAGDGGINDWYNSAFSYINNNYQPILAFNFDERQYYFNTPSDKIDMYRPNQLVAFKKK